MFKAQSELKVGDSILMFVAGQYYSPTIEAIVNEPDGRVKLMLEWGSNLGKSRVYMHDEYKVWNRLPEIAASA